MSGHKERLRVLLVEDDRDEGVLTRDLLAGAGFDLSWASTVAEGLRRIREFEPDAVLLGQRVGAETGLDFLGRLPTRGEVPPIVLLVGAGEADADVAAMRAGVADSLVKDDLTPLLLERSVRYTVERARADAELRLCDRAMAAVSEGILITDPRRPGNPVVYANSGFERLTGYAAHEVVGRSCGFLQGPDTDPAAVAEIRDAVREGRGCVVELVNYRRNGTPFWNRLSVTPVRDGSGTVTRFVEIQQDVTEQREARDELLRAREEAERTAERMRAVAAAAAGVIGAPSLSCLRDVLLEACRRVIPLDSFVFGLYDEDGDALCFVPGYDEGRFTRETRVPLAGTPAERVCRERRSAVVRRADQAGAAGARVFGSGRRSESVIRTPVVSGDRLLGLISVQSYTPELYGAPDVEVLETIASLAATAVLNLRLVEEIRESARELREVKEQQEALLNNLPDIAWLKDADGRYLAVNDSFLKLLRRNRCMVPGLGEEESAVGRTVSDIFEPEAARELVAQDRAVIGGGKRSTVEIPVRLAGGDVVWFEAVKAPIHDVERGVIGTVGIARDVTERRRAEEERSALLAELESERSRLQRVVRHAPAFIATMRGPEHVFEIANPACHQLVGRREILGRPIREVLPELEGQGFFDLMDGVRRTGEPFVGSEMPILLRREPEAPLEERFIDFVYQPMTEADGSVSGIFLHGVDVTAQVRSRREVERLAAEREAILRQISEGVVVADTSGKISFMNEAAVRLHGTGALGVPANEHAPTYHLHTAEGEPFSTDELPLVRAVRHEEVTTGAEVHIRRPDGVEVVTEVSASPVYAADGSRLGAVLALRDITERKRWEEELLKSERRFRSLVENAPDTVVVLDAQGTIRYSSPSLHRILGYPAEEMDGRYAFDLIHPDDLDRVQEVFLQLVEEPDLVTMAEYRVRHGSGEWLWFETTGHNLLHDPAVEGLVINSRDVTERKHAEEALHRSEEQLRQAQRLDAVGKLAGGVAHDFNNVLTVIQGTSEMLLMDVPERSELRTDLQEIREACVRASKLTRQLLAFSRRQVLQPRVLDLNATVTEMEGMLRRLIGEDVDLVLALDPALGRVEADPGQIEQVVMNLAVNARDAMPTGGRLEVETRTVHLDEAEVRCCLTCEHPGTYVHLAVRDTGTGMDEATLARVFEPFFTTKPHGRGTGLGLATVYGIVKQSGGCVHVESRPGEGSAFHVYLPVVAGEPDPREVPAPEAAPRPARGTILLVEDEDSVRSLACRLLERSGYRVLEAPHPGAALEILLTSGEEVDLLLTDVVMPQMSGRALASRAVEMHPELKVVYMSGYTDDALAHHGVLESGIHLIEKPFRPEALLSKVREVLT